MTQPAESPAAGLPVRTPALEPAWVRHGSATVKKEYAAALQFEQMLLTQLASSVAKSAEPGGEGSEAEGASSEPGASVYSSMLPQALASGVLSGGGLGLAAELTRQLAGRTPGAETPATGGTSAK